MSAAAIAAAVVLVGAAAAYYVRTRDENGIGLALGGFVDGFADGAQAIGDYVVAAAGVLTPGRAAGVTAADMQNKNVQAFLRVIRRGEGTADEGGYSRLFGGGTFSSYADHPRVKVTKNGYTSTAAGAYQFLSRTWDEVRAIMGLADFSPASQDWAAVGRIAARGALEDVKAGRFEAAIRKTCLEWASLPGSPYGQPTITLKTATSVFLSNGGKLA
ncbi:MAG: glycoside hydrolase family 104 protein [Zoogloeaceae bacterium]|jgi:muramidase (phage lysozyme)|nr:glycoside hydrolase family 104 protein [Zoogloeaceae bacterium]